MNMPLPCLCLDHISQGGKQGKGKERELPDGFFSPSLSFPFPLPRPLCSCKGDGGEQRTLLLDEDIRVKRIGGVEEWRGIRIPVAFFLVAVIDGKFRRESVSE